MYIIIIHVYTTMASQLYGYVYNYDVSTLFIQSYQLYLWLHKLK